MYLDYKICSFCGETFPIDEQAAFHAHRDKCAEEYERMYRDEDYIHTKLDAMADE